MGWGVGGGTAGGTPALGASDITPAEDKRSTKVPSSSSAAARRRLRNREYVLREKPSGYRKTEAIYIYIKYFFKLTINTNNTLKKKIGVPISSTLLGAQRGTALPQVACVPAQCCPPALITPKTPQIQTRLLSSAPGRFPPTSPTMLLFGILINFSISFTPAQAGLTRGALNAAI